MKQSLKKIVCGVLVATSVVACSATFTACETSTPELEVKLVFNKKTYTLSYEMNRKITPKTVQHMIALADKGYYNDKNICVHNYTSTKWYTGAYEYKDETLVELDYFNTVTNYIPKSVWLDSEKTAPTYTLYGEFEGNNFSVEKGALKESFGSLVMYYTAKAGDDEVYITPNSDASKTALRTYEKNSATSEFYISLASTSTKNNNYCVFATLDSGSVSVLRSLQKAVADYIEENYGEEGVNEFTQRQAFTANEKDPVVGGKGGTLVYDVPNEPIYLKSVKVTKY